VFWTPTRAGVIFEAVVAVLHIFLHGPASKHAAAISRLGYEDNLSRSGLELYWQRENSCANTTVLLHLLLEADEALAKTKQHMSPAERKARAGGDIKAHPPAGGY
jgi:hypothetical protein